MSIGDNYWFNKEYPSGECKSCERLSEEVKRLNNIIDNQKTSIAFLLRMLPQYEDSPEESGKRIAQETIEAIKNKLEANDD